MSVAANSSSTYQTTQRLTESDSMLADGNITVSLTSRIDYNLRFTQQAVLVVGNNTEQYSPLASQYLGNLSDVEPTVGKLAHQDNHINVAFISASSKLNDIQIRCRLIEQLFVNTLFDPEQSLAVSVLRFAKQHGEAISIVIDHAHALSLQVKYELCQLVTLAKKSKLTINVVLFGLTSAAQQLAINKSLFKNKMVIIDAESSKVISLDDNTMILNNEQSPLSFGQKVSFFSGMILLAVVLFWVYLLIADDFNQQAFNSKDQTVLEKNNQHIVLPSKSSDVQSNKSARQMQKKYKTGIVKNSVKLNVLEIRTQATSKEINQILMTKFSVAAIETSPAEAGDVLPALVIVDNKIDNNVVSAATKELADHTESVEITTNYYQTKAQEYDNGYVVQIAGYSEVKLLKRFLSLYPEENFYSYQRQLNDKSFTVITSKVYQNKAIAKATIQLLPIQLIERKPWVKSISSVINEINTFTR
ncbi:MAG: DamX protein [Colwellia sp.]|jgi:DamX protein